jgi:hypothetical protein
LTRATVTAVLLCVSPSVHKGSYYAQAGHSHLRRVGSKDDGDGAVVTQKERKLIRQQQQQTHDDDANEHANHDEKDGSVHSTCVRVCIPVSSQRLLLRSSRALALTPSRE